MNLRYESRPDLWFELEIVEPPDEHGCCACYVRIRTAQTELTVRSGLGPRDMADLADALSRVHRDPSEQALFIPELEDFHLLMTWGDPRHGLLSFTLRVNVVELREEEEIRIQAECSGIPIEQSYLPGWVAEIRRLSS